MYMYLPRVELICLYYLPILRMKIYKFLDIFSKF